MSALSRAFWRAVLKSPVSWSGPSFARVWASAGKEQAVAPGREAEPLIADERIALSAALRAYTAGTARVNHADQTGRIAVGLLADLVVLDRDPFAGRPTRFTGPASPPPTSTASLSSRPKIYSAPAPTFSARSASG